MNAVYYEASGGSREGHEAVAHVMLSRVRHPNYPKSVCEVVCEGLARAPGCQFTFICDGSLRRKPDPTSWRDAVDVATAALDGCVSPIVSSSTHYHAVRLRPVWSASMTPARRIGAHQLHRLPDLLGTVVALGGAYAGAKPGMGRPAVAARWVEAAQRGSNGSGTLAQARPQVSRFSIWDVTVADTSPQGNGSGSVFAPLATP